MSERSFFLQKIFRAFPKGLRKAIHLLRTFFQYDLVPAQLRKFKIFSSSSHFQTIVLPDLAQSEGVTDTPNSQVMDVTVQKQLNQITTFSLSHYFFLGMFSPYLALYFEAKGVSITLMGILLGLLPLARMFGPYAWTALADHRGWHKQILTLSAFVILLSLLILPQLNDVLGMSAFLLLLFVCYSAHAPLTDAWIIALTHDDWGRYGVIRGLGSLAFVVGLVMGGALLDLVDKHYLPWISAPSMFAAFVLAYFLPSSDSLVKPTTPNQQFSLIRQLTQPHLLWLLSSAFLLNAVHTGFYGFLALYLDAQGYSKLVIGVVWSVGVIAEIVWFVTQGGWMARYRPEKLIMFGNAMACVRFFLLMVVPWMPLWGALQALHAFTFGVHTSGMMAMMRISFPERMIARSQGLFASVAFGAGGVFGMIAAAWVVESFSYQGLFIAAFLTCLLAQYLTYRGYKASKKTLMHLR